MSLKHLMAGLALCLTAHTLPAAQTVVTGIINGCDDAPLEFANVALFTSVDSTYIGGTVTDVSGRFTLERPATGCFLQISAIGFEDFCIENPDGDLGRLTLIPANHRLGEVTVIQSRPVARLKSDGLQVKISGTSLAATGTALDLLGKMPYVTNNGRELEVIGKGTPLIYINGRQVRDSSELDRLSSSSIKSVDIVTSPGARYNSSANAVIRITTLTPSGEGLSFSDRSTIGYKHYAYLFEQVDFNWRSGGVDLFGSLNYENYRERPHYGSATVRYQPSGTTTQYAGGRDLAIYPVYQAKAGINCNTGNHDIGLYYDFSYRPATTSGTSSTLRLVNGLHDDDLEYSSIARRYYRQHLMSAYYNGTTGQWLLNANLDMLLQLNDRTTTEMESSSANDTRAFRTRNDVANRLLAGNISATRHLWKGDLRIGSEISDIHRKDTYLTGTDFIPDNDTGIHETTWAIFAESEQTTGNVGISVGLRWEYTDSRYYLSGQKSDDQSRKYHNLAPNLSITFPIGEVDNRISYMRKTSRPAFGQLSSAVRYLDRYSYESGNPNLKPVYRDYLTLAGVWKDISVELCYQSTLNYFMWQTRPYPSGQADSSDIDRNTDVTLLIMENMPRFSSLEATANYSPSFFDTWRPTFMAGIMTQDFKLMHNGAKMRLNKPLGIFRFNNAIRLPYDAWLNIDFSARTSGNADNIYLKSQWSCNLGLYKSFANDTWSLRLQLDDVFNTSRQQTVVYDASSVMRVTKVYDTRDLSLTLRCNINTTRSRFKGHGAADSEKSRF